MLIPVAIVNESAPFAPTDIANLQAWYDASDTATITDAGGGAVSAWADKSGNSYTLTEATNRPTTGTRTINGLNTIDFDGSNDILSSNCPADDRTSCTFAVGLLDDVSQYRTLWGSAGASNSGGNCLRVNQFTGVWAFEKQGLVSINTFAYGPSLSTAFCVALDLNDSAYMLDMNDSLVYVARGADSTTFSATTLAVGASGTTFFWDGQIAEIIRYSGTLSVSDYGKVMLYLINKWGIV